MATIQFSTYLNKPTLKIPVPNSNSNPNPKRIQCKSSSSSSSSPFTEKHSLKILQREQKWIPDPDYPPQPSSSNVKDDDIALQLPELKKLLSALKKSRERHRENDCVAGNVFLVGTGPGDPDLLTLKALKVIGSADLLLYDRLVSNDILDLVGDNARLLYVGKTAGYHSRTQVISISDFLYI